VIRALYRTIMFNNCLFENILCNGDSDDSSLLDFHSSDYGNIFTMNNVTISNCRSNGDFIKIGGNLSYVNLNNLKIDSVTSYGPVISNKSFNVSKLLLINFYINIHVIIILKLLFIIYIYLLILLLKNSQLYI